MAVGWEAMSKMSCPGVKDRDLVLFGAWAPQYPLFLHEVALALLYTTPRASGELVAPQF